MEIIPAIDVKDGKCVRLRQGREDSGTIYAEDPFDAAARWAEEGAKRLHVVNLDGAFGRESKISGLLRRIASLEGVRVQIGGGLRTRDAIKGAFDGGASAVVLGTAAFEDGHLLDHAIREYGARSIIVAIDALKGNVAKRGWKEFTGRDVLGAARDLRDAGVREILCTDIGRDGMMTGPDLSTLGSLSGSGLSVIASGGISTLGDLNALMTPEFTHVTGAIIGKALYEGTIDLRSALALAGAGPRTSTPPSPLRGNG